MALNASGAISLAGATSGQSIASELGLGTTTQISMNDTVVRTLAGVASGAITMPTNFHGKSNRVAISYTYSTNIANAMLTVSSIGGYVAGKSDITITVNSGIYVYATSTANAGLTLTGGTTGDTITLVNNGFILGQGGNGGTSSGGVTNAIGNAGGPALSLGFNTTINNTNASAYIGGGGGGGGSTNSLGYGGGGGGAGGGNGGSASAGNLGGTGGLPGLAGAGGSAGTAANGGGAGGGSGS